MWKGLKVGGEGLEMALTNEGPEGRRRQFPAPPLPGELQGRKLGFCRSNPYRPRHTPLQLDGSFLNTE